MKHNYKSYAFIAILFIIIGVLWGIVGKNILTTDNNQIEKGVSNMFESITTNLMVENVNKSLEFYVGVLGFEKLQTVPDSGDYVFAHINKDSVNLMLQKFDSSGTEIPYFKNKEIGGSFTLFVVVENVEEIYNNVKDNYKVISEMKETFYGMKEFSLLDPDGYVLTFAERISN